MSKIHYNLSSGLWVGTFTSSVKYSSLMLICLNIYIIQILVTQDDI